MYELQNLKHYTSFCDQIEALKGTKGGQKKIDNLTIHFIHDHFLMLRKSFNLREQMYKLLRKTI